MTAYLSKIAARFDGSSVNNIPENQSGTQALIPSSTTFDSNNVVENGFPLADFSNEYIFLDSRYSSGDESLTNYSSSDELLTNYSDNESLVEHKKVLKPSSNFIASSSVETIRTLFNSEETVKNIDQKPVEQSDLVIPQKSLSSKPKSLFQQLDRNSILESNKEEHVEELINNDLQTRKKEHDFYSLTTFQKKQLKNKKIQVVSPNMEKQKEQLSLEVKTASKEKKQKERQTNLPFNTVDQKELTKSQPIVSQLKPSIKKQRLKDSTTHKKHVENKIRIGSIRVEILQAKPKKVKTRTQQLQQQKVMPPSKSSVNQARFPLRFGLMQM